MRTSIAALLLAATAGAQELTFSGGGRLREQFEHFHNREFGEVRPRSDSYVLHRLQLRGEVSYGRELHGLVEFVNALALDQQTPKAPLDEDRIDILRAQVDWTPRVPGLGEGLLRVGRQELMLGRGRLVSAREGPNVRRAFDGVRGMWRGGEGPEDWTLDAFALTPVDQRLGSFDDRIEEDERFYGVVFGAQLHDDLRGELYWLGRDRPDTTFVSGGGDEFRSTVGARIAGEVAGVDVDVELMGQTGTVGPDSIRAFAVSVLVERELDLPWKLRPGLRLDWISGDGDPDDGHVETFDALYPNNSYFNEAAAFAPANLRSVIPTLGMQPFEGLRIDLMWDFAWRDQVEDAVYVPPGVPAFPGHGNERRFVGHSATMAAEWECREDLSITLAWTHFEAGGAVTSSGGRDLDYVAVWVNYWF